MNAINQLMETITWQAVEPTAGSPGVLHATHHGVLEVAGLSFRCYRLSDGRAVIHKDDIETWLGPLLTEDRA